jgi:conjugative relaxase-like TrwC/TraI family protein
MFTMAKIRDGSTYLAQHLTANDYYCEQETVTGRWHGNAAERLGLSGEIRAGDLAFERLRQNRHPDGSGKLTPRDGADRIRFYDFQCSAQKSVSIMAVTLGDARLLRAHDEAAAKAFGELEKFAACQANTTLTRENRLTGNVVAAVFRHTASRALDPQVHTHFVVANATWDETTRLWRALTEYEMVMAIRYAGKVYQNELASACRRLGYAIESVRNQRGVITGFEISGVAAELRDRFSKRRAEVERGIGEFRQHHGRDPTVAEVHAITVATRDVKLKEATTPAVLAAQRAQLSPAEARQLESIKSGTAQRASFLREGPGRERESLALATGHLFERCSVVAGHELLAEALNQNLGQVNLGQLHHQAAASELIGLTGEPWLRERFATRQGLAWEKWSVDFVNRTLGHCEALAFGAKELSARLSVEQQAAVARVLASRDQVTCLRGAAGVGKTTVLREIDRALGEAGKTAFYCTPTSSAADTLRRDGLMQATTVSDFLENTSLRERERLAGAVLVVDEAGLASNRQGAEILRLAERHDCRVLFLGDSRQHTSVEAGDFLRVLETHSQMARIELTEIRRQLPQDYRAAVRLMAAGAARAGLERLDALGWIKEGRVDYLHAAVEDYLRQSQNGQQLETVLAVTPTWAENYAFTDSLRDRLKAQGVLRAGEIVTVHDSLQWTRAQKENVEHYQPGMVVSFTRKIGGFARGDSAEVVGVAHGRVFVRQDEVVRPLPAASSAFDVARPRPLEISPGDRVLIRANDRVQNLLNGEILTVASLENGLIRATDGRVIDSRRFRQFAHGYAVTSHKAQSQTVDHVVVAAERLDAKSAYVACSRGRLSCAVHTPDRTALLSRLPEGNRAAVLDVLAGAGRLDPGVFARASAWAHSTGQRAREWLATVERKLAQGWNHAMGDNVTQRPWPGLHSVGERRPLNGSAHDRG